MCEDRGAAVSLAVLRRQIAAMPCRLYEVRLIHSDSRKPYPGVRQWTVSQLLNPATVGFLRIRNREGYDVYFRPYAGDHNAGYILLDLDDPVPGIGNYADLPDLEPCLQSLHDGYQTFYIRRVAGPKLDAHRIALLVEPHGHH